MNVLVLGAGLMGRALVYDLARSNQVGSVTVADIDLECAKEVVKKYGNSKASAVTLDVRDYKQVIEVMRDCDVAISAVTLHYNDSLAKAAVDSGVNFCDLGGSDDIVQKEKTLDEEAKRKNITIIPNCGLAPGMASVLTMLGVSRFDRVFDVHIRVGGLPQNPRPPLGYQLVFTVEGLLQEYSGKAKVLRDGRVAYVDALTEIESIEFPEPFGILEAFQTSGGTSFLPELLEGKVRTLDYKTIRYPGHAEKFKTLLDLGFAGTEPISVGDHLTTPRELFAELLRRKLSFDESDVVLMRITLRGIVDNREKTLVFQMIDRFDEKTSLTAMMRTTSFPTSIIAQMIGSGLIPQKGVLTPEECVPGELFLSELHNRNIIIDETWI